MNGLPRRARLRPVASALVALMLPLAAFSIARTPEPAETKEAAAPAGTAETVRPVRAPAPLPEPARDVPPLPDTFDLAGLESMAEQLTWGNRVPGLAMTIVHGGQVLSARGYGVTDVSNPEPVDAHTVFRLASLSKAFAGTMAGLLVEDGVLRWDSRVAELVPGFALSSPQATGSLTVADVLSHRVGLPFNAFDRDIEANADYRDLVRRLASVKPVCQPGDCYAYQNVAFSLVGDVVFNSSGQFYEQAVERRILKPLGMHDASLGLHGLMGSARWARPHVHGRTGWVSITPKPNYYRVTPAAGVNASASDMAQWLLAHTGHRPDVLSAPLLATLHAPRVNTPGELRAGWRRERLRQASYALGWRVFDYQGHDVIFHAGAVQGYRGLVALVPERDFGVAVLWNGENSLPSGLLPVVVDAALGLPLDRRWLDVEPLTPTQLAARRPAGAPVPTGITASRAAAAAMPMPMP